MRKWKTESRTHEATILDELRCDLCGRRGTGTVWESGSYYTVNGTEVSVKVHQKEGFECPDGGGGMEYVIDLCPECFKKRLVPWLISQGATIKPVEWEW